MPEELLSLSELQWTAVQAVAVSVSSFILVVTVIIAVRQLRQAARSAQFDAVIRMQELVEDFREDRRQLYENLPIHLAFTQEQFALKVPRREKKTDHSFAERRRKLLTAEQTAALASMADSDFETARRVITRFNDIGQLIDDGFFPENTFYDKHHLMVLRGCHQVEAIRRNLEDESEGGNYGRRLLAMRATAASYYDRIPKHADAAVHVRNSQGRRAVYQTKPGPLKRGWQTMAHRIRKT